MTQTFADGTLSPDFSEARSGSEGFEIYVINGWAKPYGEETLIGKTKVCGQVMEFVEWKTEDKVGVSFVLPGDERRGYVYFVETNKPKSLETLKSYFAHLDLY